MLRHLSIANIAVIEALELDFLGGLTVMTGETGAGKSILLDSLGLVLGRRGDATLIREGCAEARVSAEFDISKSPDLQTLLRDQGFGDASHLLLRRVLYRDGRSRAWINDTSAGIKLLRSVGTLLLEIVGQYAQMELFNEDEPQDILDNFAKVYAVCEELSVCYRSLGQIRAERERERKHIAQREDAIRVHEACIADLNSLNYHAGELGGLEKKRRQLQASERLQAVGRTMQEALQDTPDPLERIRHARRELQVHAADIDDDGVKTLQALEKAEEELVDAMAYFDIWVGRIGIDPQSLEMVDERFFAIKALCRKYDCNAEDLPVRLGDAKQSLLTLDEGEAHLRNIDRALAEKEKEFSHRVHHLHDARQSAAVALSKALNIELPPLKLEKARFAIDVHLRDPEKWNDKGGDSIQFLFSANPGSALGPLTKVASGGEMSRFLLALKLVLADSHDQRGFVFDEIDMAVGGSTAAAIGKRLRRLSESHQVLVITHSAQVAAFGDQHLRIAKESGYDNTKTTVQDITEPKQRREEIARMLAGHNVTDAARQAARSLLALR